MDLYSASVEDREITGCFFVFHEINELPNKTQYPVTYFRETGQEA